MVIGCLRMIVRIANENRTVKMKTKTELEEEETYVRMAKRKMETLLIMKAVVLCKLKRDEVLDWRRGNFHLSWEKALWLLCELILFAWA